MNLAVCFRYATYYRKFIKGFSNIAEQLNRFLQKDYDFQYTDGCKESFRTIKSALAKSITFAYPYFLKQFIVDCDASDFGLGWVLFQVIRSGVEQPVRYFS